MKPAQRTLIAGELELREFDLWLLAPTFPSPRFLLALRVSHDVQPDEPPNRSVG